MYEKTCKLELSQIDHPRVIAFVHGTDRTGKHGIIVDQSIAAQHYASRIPSLLSYPHLLFEPVGNWVVFLCHFIT